MSPIDQDNKIYKQTVAKQTHQPSQPSPAEPATSLTDSVLADARGPSLAMMEDSIRAALATALSAAIESREPIDPSVWADKEFATGVARLPKWAHHDPSLPHNVRMMNEAVDLVMAQFESLRESGQPLPKTLSQESDRDVATVSGKSPDLGCKLVDNSGFLDDEAYARIDAAVQRSIDNGEPPDLSHRRDDGPDPLGIDWAWAGGPTPVDIQAVTAEPGTGATVPSLRPPYVFKIDEK